MVEINRVAKVVKGGRRFSFTALVVIGDEVDRVGVGYGKAREVPLAISKAVDDAKKNLFTVPKHGTTITHEILGQLRRGAGAPAPGQRGNRRHRRRRRARGARARRHPRRAREEPRHDEPDQHAQGDGRRPASACAGPRTSRETRGKTISEVLPWRASRRPSPRSPSRRRSTPARARRRRGGRDRACGGVAAAEPEAAAAQETAAARGGDARVSASSRSRRSAARSARRSATAARCARSASARSAAPPSTTESPQLAGHAAEGPPPREGRGAPSAWPTS